jgi:hypothetical protein
VAAAEQTTESAGTATAQDDQKAKYNKGMDFFDCISNST